MNLNQTELYILCVSIVIIIALIFKSKIKVVGKFIGLEAEDKTISKKIIEVKGDQNKVKQLESENDATSKIEGNANEIEQS